MSRGDGLSRRCKVCHNKMRMSQDSYKKNLKQYHIPRTEESEVPEVHPNIPVVGESHRS